MNKSGCVVLMGLLALSLAAVPAMDSHAADSEFSSRSSGSPGSMGSSAKSEVTAQPMAIGDSFFGEFRYHLGASHVAFDDGMKYYDKLYGSASPMYHFGIDWFPSRWTPPFLAIGAGFRSAFYRDTGHASSSKTDAVVSKGSPTELTILPLQAGIVAEFTILPEKWVVFEGWSMLERAYFQEVRTTADVSAAIRTPAMAASSSTNADDALVNRGWKNGIVNGMAINVLLNFLDQRSIRSQRGAMGLGYVYLSFFAETVTDAANSGMNFGRRVNGVSVNFESVH